MDGEFDDSMDMSSDVDVSDTDVSTDVPEDVPDDVPEDIPEDDAISDSDDIAEDIPEDDNVDEGVSDDTDFVEDLPEDIEDEAAPEEVSDMDDISEDTGEDTSVESISDIEDIPEDINDDTLGEDFSEVEDIPEDVVGSESDAESTDIEDAASDVDAGDTADMESDAESTDTGDEAADTDAEDTADAESDVESTDTEEEAIDVDVKNSDLVSEASVNADVDKEIHEDESPMNQLAAYMSAHNYGPDDFAEYSQDPEWQNLHSKAFPDYTSPETSDTDTQESAFQQLSDYMNAHNYGPDDFAEYSQDPEWQKLHSEAFPDYTPPETSDTDTQESAFQKLSDYMSAHNYGSDDFGEYSQDPNWRLLQKDAFPNYDMPPLAQENAQRQLAQFMNDHDYDSDDFEEYCQNPVWRELQSAAYPDYEMPKYDDSAEAKELREMGIPNVDLRDCRPEYREDVVDAVKDAISECPELKSQLTKINCHEMPEGTYASYGPTRGNKKFGGCLNLNSKNFSSSTLQSELTEESKQGWSVPNSSPKSVISHELGHGMHLDLCAKSCGLEYGKVPESGRFNRAVQQYIDDVHADKIVEAACNDCGVKFDSWDFADCLTRYGASSYGEALAEAVAEVRNNAIPRPMAETIYRRLMEYRERMAN